MNKKQYINEIVQRSCLPTAERRRLKADLESEINAAIERGEYIEQIIERMGDPDKIAAEIYENCADSSVRPFREYKSEVTVFGLPLVHIIRPNYRLSVPQVRAFGARGINVGGRYGNFHELPTARGFFAFGPKAKGVFAVGNLSAGFISIGNITAGFFSIGNISAGLFSIGNIALALLLVLGNLAAGPLAAGNLAVGYAAAGNVAVGQYAVGNEVAGTFTFLITNFAAQFAEMKAYLAALAMPSPVRLFYSTMESIAETLLDPAQTLSFIVALLAVVTFFTLLILLVPHRLLNACNAD